ncbi:type I restriction enzyme S subunit [Pseudoscardovia suis]|uniref:Type I site-specific deoxyribonuclease specificity subunit n=1 Tax=Pseudoscardovia suis TaxID=987063 RepID=A0A261ERQ3_9BIFI|nr:type I site-specific deoxyribonuclease specificity subunit [Pseudoscardovia suis]PJJ69662.1 type I restriction enzyme S subunit [Pseudoscardovia suis]
MGELYAPSREKNNGAFSARDIISVAGMRYASRESSNSTDDYMRTYNVMRVGDIAFEGHTSNEFAFGRFVENDLGDGIISHVFVVLRPLPGRRYDLAFWKEAIHDEFLMKRILARSTKRSTMMHEIVVPDFLKEVVAVPSLSEQQKIGQFFSTLDSLIAAAERQEALLRQKKQAYLQLMFPQEGETQPRLRSNGFSGDWEQRQLGEVAEVVIGQSPEGRYSSDNQNGVALAQGNTDIADGVFVPRVWTSRPTKVVPAGTLLVSVRAPVGDVAVTPVPACIGRGFAGIPGNSFLRYSLERLKTSGHWNRVSSGSVLDAITSKELLQTPISIATNQEEQCIGKFFTRLDHLIGIVGRHAETLRTMKRAYSQRMFI